MKGVLDWLMGKRSEQIPRAKYAALEGQPMNVGATKYDLILMFYREREDWRIEMEAIRRELGMQSATLGVILDRQSKQQGEIMARFDDVKTQSAANVAQLLKGFNEVTALIAELEAKQAAQDAAIVAAVAAQKAGDDAAFEVAMVDLQTIQTEETALIQRLDAIKPDAPTPEPTPTP